MSRKLNLFFLEAKMLESIFNGMFFKVCSNYAENISFDCMFQAVRALTVRKILKTRILSQNCFKIKAFPCFVSNALN